jgi:hypothetical protein
MPTFLSGIDPRVYYAVVIFSAIIVWLANSAAERKRRTALRNRIGPSFLAKAGAQPLPGSINILASLGESAAPKQSLDEIIMTPTIGVRGIAAVLTLIFLWATWGGTFDEMMPKGMIFKWALTGSAALALLNTFLFEARVTNRSLVLTKFALWKREYLWRDFTTIKDDRHYLYFLHFSKGGKVSIPKHLVGMPGFLKFIGVILEQNETPNARVARS